MKPSLNRIYCTGSANIDPAAEIKCWNGDPINCADHIIPIDTVTIYGNFDGDATIDLLDDPEDVIFFNAAFPSVVGDATYNPLADFDCDGEVGCTDRAQLVSNWQFYVGVECGTCSAPGCP